jgi:ACR3 family arsenite transporter
MPAASDHQPQEAHLMSEAVTGRPAPARPPMSVFERYLTVWVFVCILVGLLIWVMIIPMLVKVDFAALHEVRRGAYG